MTGCLYFEAFYGNYVLSARNATKIREEMKHFPPSFYSLSLMPEPLSLHVMHLAQACHQHDVHLMPNQVESAQHVCNTCTIVINGQCAKWLLSATLTFLFIKQQQRSWRVISILQYN